MRVCDVYRCDEKHVARGYCRNHHAQFVRTGSPFGSNRPKAVPKPPRPKRTRFDPTGEQHGEWTVLGLAEKADYVLVRCACGFEAPRSYASIKGGKSKSCGHSFGWDQRPRQRAPSAPSSEESIKRARDARSKKAAFIQQYKLDRGCQDCGLRPPHSMMLDFDHLPQYEKLFSLSKASSHGWVAIHAEIAKCEVVCRNCHAYRTATRLAVDAA